MLINLDRYQSTKIATNGQIFLNSAHYCYSLEDIVRPLGKKVYGKTAIPAGIYEVTLEAFRGNKEKMYPYLHHVPGFQGIFIHGGNTADDTLGCILAGFREAKDWVGECAPCLKELCHRISEALMRKEPVKIEIMNAKEI